MSFSIGIVWIHGSCHQFLIAINKFSIWIGSWKFSPVEALLWAPGWRLADNRSRLFLKEREWSCCWATYTIYMFTLLFHSKIYTEWKSVSVFFCLLNIFQIQSQTFLIFCLLKYHPSNIEPDSQNSKLSKLSCWRRAYFVTTKMVMYCPFYCHSTVKK